MLSRCTSKGQSSGDRRLAGVRIALVYPPYGPVRNEPGLKVVKENYGLFQNLSLLYVASTLEQAGATVLFLDAHAEGWSLNEVAARLRAFSPDFVGYTLTTYLFYQTLRWLEAIKRAVPAKVIVGGVHVGLYPTETLQRQAIDYGVTGEAEVCLVPLLEAVLTGAPLGGLPGLVFRDESGQIVVTRSAPSLEAVDEAPFPARHLLQNEHYYSFVSQIKNFSPLITSRGCPFRCIFCEQGGKPFRGRSARNVVDELEVGYHEHGIREYDFFDSSFTIDKARVFAICDEIRRRGLVVAWSVRSRPDCVDKDILKALKRAGCMRIYYGIESGNAGILRTLRKGTDLAQVRQVLQETRAQGIRTFGYFMIGSPGETIETVEQTIRFSLELALDYAQFSKVTPMPGTELYSLYLEEKGRDFWRDYLRDEALEEAMSRPGTLLSDAEVETLTRQAYLRFYYRPSAILRALARVQSLEELKRSVRTAFSMGWSALSEDESAHALT